MKKNTFTLILAFCSTLCFGQANYYQKQATSNVDYVPIELAGYMTPGQSFNLVNPLEPRPATLSPFKGRRPISNNEELRLLGLDQPVDTNVIEIINGTYIESVSEEAKAKSLFINFRAKFGFANASAAYNQVKNEQSTSKTVQYIYELKKSGQTLPDDNKTWGDRLNFLENDANQNLLQRSDKFLEQFGSHYVSSVQYGFRIEVLATYFSSNSSEQETFNLAMRAWLMKGSFSGDWKSSLKSSNTRILCSIISGGLQPNTSAILNSFDEVDKFFTELKAGKIKILNGPIGFYLQSYKGTLSDKPRCRAVFEETQLAQNFDFPKGTIIAWAPSPDYIINGQPTPPNGWIICDGKNGSPNLIDKFIYGSDKDFNTEFGNSNIVIEKGKISSRVTWFGEPIRNPGPLLGPGVNSGWGHYHTLLSENTNELRIENKPLGIKLIYLMKQ